VAARVCRGGGAGGRFGAGGGWAAGGGGDGTGVVGLGFWWTGGIVHVLWYVM
jgi:hypothetical protein